MSNSTEDSYRGYPRGPRLQFYRKPLTNSYSRYTEVIQSWRLMCCCSLSEHEQFTCYHREDMLSLLLLLAKLSDVSETPWLRCYVNYSGSLHRLWTCEHGFCKYAAYSYFLFLKQVAGCILIGRIVSGRLWATSGRFCLFILTKHTIYLYWNHAILPDLSP